MAAKSMISGDIILRTMNGHNWIKVMIKVEVNMLLLK